MSAHIDRARVFLASASTLVACEPPSDEDIELALDDLEKARNALMTELDDRLARTYGRKV